LVRVQYASLINILTHQPIFPEYIQGDATVDQITPAMMALLPPEKRQERVQAIETALLALSPTHPPEKPSAVAAQTILGLLAPSS
jgi:lipid A disaccharide synthetase